MKYYYLTYFCIVSTLFLFLCLTCHSYSQSNCFPCDKDFDNYYLFNKSSYPKYQSLQENPDQSSSIIDYETNKNFEIFVEKLLNSSPDINILFLCGSVTGGVNCKQDLLEVKLCAWSNRFGDDINIIATILS